MFYVFPNKPSNMFIDTDRHNGIWVLPPPAPPAPTPPFGVHIGTGTLAMTFPPFSKIKVTTFADKEPMIGHTHSVNFCIIHLPVAPPLLNTLLPIIILGSTNSCDFGVMGVVLGDATTPPSTDGTAISLGCFVGINLACNDPIDCPTSLVINPISTVLINFTLADLIFSLIIVGISMLVSFGLNKLGKYLEKLPLKNLAKNMFSALMKKMGLPRLMKKIVPTGALILFLRFPRAMNFIADVFASKGFQSLMKNSKVVANAAGDLLEKAIKNDEIRNAAINYGYNSGTADLKNEGVKNLVQGGSETLSN